MICASIKKSVAPSTFAAWLQWLSYLTSNDKLPSTFSEYLLLSFLNILMSQSLSWAHINKNLAELSFFLKLSNHTACNTFFSVKQALKGYKRGSFHLDTRMAITPSILSQLCKAANTVCFSSFEANLFWAVFCILFFGALRISKVVPPYRYTEPGILFTHVWLKDCKLRKII